MFIKRWIQTFEYAKVEGYYIHEIENGDEVVDNTTYTIRFKYSSN
jgi:hypothetical protein